MKPFPLTWRPFAVAAAALVAASSWAMTIGRAQSVALVGRPLEVRVPLALAEGEALPECVQAEVFYGDSRVDPGRVTAELLPGGASPAARVRSSVLVDEPVVTVYLHVGCTSKLTRRFVLLAEQPDPSADAPVAAPVRPRAPAPAIPRAEPVAPVPQAARAPATASQSAAAPAAASAPRTVRPAPAARPQARPEAPRPAARLQLEPLDLTPEPEPSLRLSERLSPDGGASEAQRAQARAVWRALNATPQELLQDGQRLAALERELAALRVSTQRNDAALAQLRGELQVAQAQRYANPLVYALFASTLAAAALALLLWRRRRPRTAGQWWHPRPGADSDFASVPAPLAPRAAGPARGSPPPAVDLDLSFTESALQRLHAAPPSRPPGFAQSGFQHSGRGTDFHHSQPGSMRSVRAEELHDVQQEADFFVSLGEYDRAIEVLRSHISLNPGTSAIAWLDLLEIYHKRGRREDYDWVRGEFLRNFNVQVPPFEAYRESGAGLETYPSAMARIVALWPSRKVLELIEDALFGKPGHAGEEAFSLEAYRELLLLHTIGQDVLQPAAAGTAADRAAASSFTPTAIHPLAATPLGQDEAAPAAAPADAPVLAFPTLGHAVDIDLDDPTPHAAPPVAEAPLPELPGNMLDFDLPDVDTTSLRTRKTRE